MELKVLVFIGCMCLSYVNGQHSGMMGHFSPDHYMLDYPGSYCSQRPGGCCNNREDSCSVPISTTLCYCDNFCNRLSFGEQSGDCCPDYESFCLNAPPPNITEMCYHKGIAFDKFSPPIKDNCNLCKCGAYGKTKCEQDLCLMDENLINNVNKISHQIGWTARNYSEFWGHKYSEGLELRLGTIEPSARVKAMSRISHKLEMNLPSYFNSVDKWRGLISEVKDQGWCGSSWAVSTVSVATDRFAIHSKGREIQDLSPQQLLSCVRRQQGCKGGHLDWAWNYFRKFGLVDEHCFPYIAASNQCKIRRSDDLMTAGCTLPTKVPRTDFYKVGPAYALNNETDIMIEIMKSGPVQATMKVYRDFFTYSDGVYRHTAASRSEPTGFHSVRLVGWGEDNQSYPPTKYWIAANSWGPMWGEGGYFRIVRGQNESEIEGYVLATWPHLYAHKKRVSNDKRRRSHRHAKVNSV